MIGMFDSPSLHKHFKSAFINFFLIKQIRMTVKTVPIFSKQSARKPGSTKIGFPCLRLVIVSE